VLGGEIAISHDLGLFGLREAVLLGATQTDDYSAVLFELR